MSDSDADAAMWPGSPYALTDTRLCPGCFSGLTGPTCSHCGLAVDDPRAANLLELGRSIFDLEAERQRLIDEIRLAHRPAPAVVALAEPEPTQPWRSFPPPTGDPLSTVPSDQAHPPTPLPSNDLSAPVLSSVPSDVAIADAVAAGAVASATGADTAVGDTARADAAVADTLVADTRVADTLVADTAVANPAVTDAVIADAAVADTPIADPPRSAPGQMAPVIAPRPPRRRLTVPVLLLIVGVSLVGVAAIFFLVLAWNIADIRVRALIIGGITLATMVVASLLRRWSLTATAEAIAVLGVILLALDSWAVRANDLFDTGAVDAVVYAGVAAFAVGVVCRLWALISRLRGPDLAATLALPTGLGLLIAGLVPLETSGAIAAGFIGTAVGGLAHALPAPWSSARSASDSVPERTALAAIGTAALLGGAVMVTIGLESMLVQLVAAGLVIVIGIAYALLLRPREGRSLPAARAFAAAAGAVAGAATASLGWQMAAQSELPLYDQLLAPVIAVAVAVGLDRWQRRDAAIVAARIAAAVVAALLVVGLVLSSAVRAAIAIVQWTPWQVPAFESEFMIDAAMLSAIAAVIVAVLSFFARTLDRPVLRELRPVAAAIVVLVGALGTAIPAVIVAAATVIAAIALVALVRANARVGWGVTAGIGAVTAFLAGLATPWLWALGVLVAVAVPIVARAIVRPKEIGGLLLAVAPVAVVAVASFIAPAAVAVAFDVTVDARAAFVLLQWVAALTLAGAVAIRLDPASHVGLAISSYGLFVISLLGFLAPPAAEDSVSAAVGEPVLGIVRAAAMLGLLAVVALWRTHIDAAPSLGAAALIAPAAACLASAVLESADVTEDGWVALAVTGSAAAVVWLGALIPARFFRLRAPGGTAETADAGNVVSAVAQHAPADARGRFQMFPRRLADLGALATTLAVAWSAPVDLRWAILLIVAAGFAGASVTRGWAGVKAEEPSGIPETRAGGVAVGIAPRRLLAWPAFAAATFALWSWLDGSGSYLIEAFVLPPAVGLALFAAMLVWLRRRVEATIAVVASFTLGLVVPAVVTVIGPLLQPGLTGDPESPVRGTVVAIVAGALAVILAWTPVRRVRMPALAGATVAIIALAIVAVDRAIALPAGTGWLLLLVGAAYVSAFGFVRRSAFRKAPVATSDGTPVPLSAEITFAAIVPTIALAVAAGATVSSVDEPIVVTVALAILGLLHLAAAALHRTPLAAATRWTAFAGATLITGMALLRGEIDAVESVSLPLAGVLLGGAALAMWRRDRAGQSWPGGERIAWLAGLSLAVAPSIIAAPNDPRTWLVIVASLLAAIGCVVAPIADSTALKAPSALLLSAGALAMGLRALLDPDVASGDFAAVAAGAGALLVAAAMVWMSDQESAPVASTALAAPAAALLVAVVFVQSNGELVQTSLTAILAGAIGVGGAALLRWRRWTGIGAVLAVAGLIAALIAVGSRFALVAGDAGVEPDLWALVGVGILAAVGIMAIRSTTSGTVATAVGVAFSIALVLFAGAELLLLGSTGGEEVRTVVTMSALTAAGVAGWMWRSRLGVSFAPTAGALAFIFGIVALTLFAIRPVELVTVPPAVGMIFLGARALRRNSALRTWPTLGPGLALLTIPSLLHDFGTTSLWRVVALGVVGIGLVVVGAVWRLQAPLFLGSVVVLVHAVNQLWPWIEAVYDVVPWWLWLGLGGALLIYIAARYERRMRALRTAFAAVTSLR